MSVNTKMTAIADEIRAKTGGEELLTLDDMAENITKVYEAGQSSMVDESKIIEKTVTGNPIFLDDVSEVPHNVEVDADSDCTIKVYGKNLYEPTVDTMTVKGITITRNEDNSYTVNGTATSDAHFHIGACSVNGNSRYYCSGGVPEAQIAFQIRNGSSGINTVISNDSVVIADSQATTGNLFDTLNPVIVVREGATVNNVVVKPMISLLLTKEYEKCSKTEYATSNNKATIPSDSPYMTLIADDVNLVANYHKSYGMQMEYDRFWDAFQDGGKAQNYYYAFAYEKWNDNNYNPKCDIKSSDGTTTGRYIFSGTHITDTKVGIYTNANNAAYIFSDAELVTIRLFHVQETTTFSNAFTGCDKLVNLTMGGTIGQTVTFAPCSKLTKESIYSIVTHLSTTKSGITVTFSKTAVNKAFGIDIDDPETYPEGSEWYELRNSKSNWTFNFS